MRPERQMILQERKLQAMRERIVGSVCLSIEEMATHLGVSRSTVAAYPPEVCPWFDGTPESTRERRRYSPAEVEATKVRLRRWSRAKARGEGEEYLRALREEMQREEEEILQAARDARRTLAGVVAA